MTLPTENVGSLPRPRRLQPAIAAYEKITARVEGAQRAADALGV